MDYANQSLAEIAINIPMSTELFRKHRLDFCCGGKQTLKEACEKKSIQVDSIVKELNLLSAGKTVPEERSLKELVSFILERYHNDLRKRLPELLVLSQKVERVHNDHENCPHGLSDLLKNLQDDMLMHMMKEENVLFPLIVSGRGSMTQMPIKVMEVEHDAHGIHLEEIRFMTSDFTPPQEACPTWKALYKGLEKLEEELMAHIHLENHVLFPRTLSGEA